jgi:hypothetical protein
VSAGSLQCVDGRMGAGYEPEAEWVAEREETRL